MKRMLTIWIVLAIAMAGCTSDAPATEQEEEEPGTAITPTPYSPGSNTPPGQAPREDQEEEATEEEEEEEQGNRPPLISFQASHSDALPGTIVSFDFSATDPDGDPLTWTFNFGGGEGEESGLQLPFSLANNYTVQGTYRIHLTVTDGEVVTPLTHWLEIDPTKGPNTGLTHPRSWAGSTQVSNPSGVCLGDGYDGMSFNLYPDMGNWSYVLHGAENLPDAGVVNTNSWTVTFTGGDTPGLVQGTEGSVPNNSTSALICNRAAGPFQPFTIIFYDEGWVRSEKDEPDPDCSYYC